MVVGEGIESLTSGDPEKVKEDEDMGKGKGREILRKEGFGVIYRPAASVLSRLASLS
jgi:hypothetical protein